ncbi:LacI family DNA-binding transcriptional regulator [Levilactobacillus namurensis]|uniref:LacI family DNA-binding transcriptional regulator n=1 Tax=Levilactobacillus namurensis TaxID=380393 RepID=UPI001DEDF490|nr:LacI family DNA-binding transcriptional regulator [Levilactobacillus namurensis]MCW3778388.1 LacI family DNA-binding transcriptional regulator [Levilactobacillus namurensis]MDT7019722.1 LacI family DNA-binding transcriptional regulator [Levilactobacillus namurensis]WNN65690.1 LacI family DNA-binding transcriptional regulator [Levilactobacillus namurensis]HJE45019.1 LacI family DNA-binding transcriptional regulator [Levilactobacillus namurensis]
MAQKAHKNANIKDVAALAGVSIATVSRFLNGNLGRMSAATATKVQDAITKLNYVPNSVARQMITRSSKMVAVIVANIDDYFSTELFKGISSILESQGYIGVLFDANSDIEREKTLLQTIGSHMFDGLILQSFSNPQTVRENLHQQMPIVSVDREMDACPWPQVISDNYDAAREATAYFERQGFTHVVALTSEVDLSRTRRERIRGIQAASSDVDVLEVSEASYNHSDVYQQLTRLIQKSREKTVVFALKERWLLEFFPNLIIQGLIDNQDVTATGFADTEFIRRMEPKLTLLTQNPFLMGASSAEIMLRELAGETVPPEKTVIPVKLQ